MVTKAISKQVNRSLRGGHLVIGPVLFLAISSQKHSAQALCWLSITKESSGTLVAAPILFSFYDFVCMASCYGKIYICMYIYIYI